MRLLPSLIVMLCFAGLSAHAQEKAAWSDSKFYSHTNGEIIFGFADAYAADDEKLNTPLRFSMAAHFGQFRNYDPGRHIGFYTGITVRNIGFITKNDTSRIKFRSYTLGIPVAIKIGNLKKGKFIFVGGEYEWLFNFKQKEFMDGKKIKTTEWFSGRTATFLPSVFAGLQFAGGTQLMYKMYLDNFFNTGFTQKVRGVEYRPYEGLEAQLFYVSLAFNMKNKKVKERIKPEAIQASTWVRK